MLKIILCIITLISCYFIYKNRSIVALYTPKRYFFWLVLFLSLFTAFSISGTILFFPKDQLVIFSSMRLLLFLLITIMLFLNYIVSLFFIHKVITKYTYTSRSKAHSKNFITSFYFQAFTTILVGSLIYWIICFPANMSTDSVEIWDEIHNGWHTDYHSILYTLLQKLLLKIWYSPAIISLVQVFSFSLIIALWMDFFYKKGVPKLLVLIVFGIPSLMPITGALVVTLWKDVPSLLSILLVLYCMLQFIIGSTIHTKKLLIYMGLFLGLSVAFRSNNIAIWAMGLFILLLVAYFNKKPQFFLIPLLASVVVFILVFVGVHKLLDVHKSTTTNNRNSPVFMPIHTAYIYGVEDTLSPDVRQFAKQIDEDVWRKYGHTFVNDFFWIVRCHHPEYLALLEQSALSQKRYINNYLQLWTHSPLLHLRTRLNFIDPFWNRKADYFAITAVVCQNKVIQNRTNKIYHILNRWTHFNLKWYPLWINSVLLLFIGCYWLIYGDKRKLIVLFPWFSNIALLFWISPSADYRYFWIGSFTLPIVICLSLISINKKRDNYAYS